MHGVLQGHLSTQQGREELTSAGVSQASQKVAVEATASELPLPTCGRGFGAPFTYEEMEHVQGTLGDCSTQLELGFSPGSLTFKL